MLLIGLTGSIATGKSSCSAILSAPPYSLPIIDADQLARDAVQPGSAGYNAVVRHFGPTTPDLLLPPDPNLPGEPRFLNRPALGRRVFGNDPEKARDRAVLNGIIHPIVRRAMVWAILRNWWKGHWACVLDVPLLFESGWDLLCGGVVVVGVSDPEMQIQRLLLRDKEVTGGKMTREDAERRVESQMSVAEKAERLEACWGGGPDGKRKGYLVWNDGTKEELARRVGEVVRKFQKGRGWWWTRLGFLIPPWILLRIIVLWLGNWYRRRKFLAEKAKQGDKGKTK